MPVPHSKRYSPHGARSATLQITDNDPSHNPFTLTLTGTGIANPAPALSGSSTFNAGSFQLTFNAAVGQHYRVLVSDDVFQPLTNWWF